MTYAEALAKFDALPERRKQSVREIIDDIGAAFDKLDDALVQAILSDEAFEASLDSDIAQGTESKNYPPTDRDHFADLVTIIVKSLR